MWTVNEGWEPLPGIGPGPIEDDDFEVAAAAYGAMHACTVEEIKAGPVYQHVAGKAKAPAASAADALEAKE